MDRVKYKMFILIILVSIICILVLIYNLISNKYNLIQSTSIQYYDQKNSNQNKENYAKGIFSYNLFKSANAYLTIPIINLYNIPIKDGTSQEIMKKYIGHFENTSFDTGNIGLASHNRGMGANYFENIHKLNKGDNIYYKYENVIRKYKVNKKIVIDSYDWNNLESTTKNVLTLITCIENKPNLRLCIQAIQI